MKQFTYLLSVTLVLFFLSACITIQNGSDKKDKPSTETNTGSNPGGDEGSGEVEEEVKNDGTYSVTTKGVRLPSKTMGIRIVSVKESRCPTNTNCFVAGEAKVLLAVTIDGRSVESTVIAKGNCEGEKGNCGTSTNVAGTKIQLLNVYPYPTASSKIELDEYIAKIKIN